MSDKPETVDLISDATRQNWRKQTRVIDIEPDIKEKKLSNWPPERMEHWRLQNLTPWKMKLRPWKYKDWT